ncbi:MAG: hypothetical protein IH946_12295, partial [Bacteroidetes bacterium]|nr:hypothetical protein [Bacteroidota bacterium]
MKELLSLALILFAFNGFGQITLDWSDPMEVTDTTTFDNSRPRVAVTSSGVPVVIWGSKNFDILYVSRMDGSDFSDPMELNPTGEDIFTGDWAGPEIAAQGDTVFVTFKLKPEDNWGVYIKRSVDGGVTWDDTVRVENIDSDMTRFPTINVLPGGNPVVAFMKLDP